MSRKFKIALKALLVLLVVLAAAALWKRDEIARLIAVNALFSEEKIVSNFSNMDAAFLTVDVPRGDGPASLLPKGTPASLPPGIEDWVKERQVTSLVVLKDGKIVFEDYYLGTSSDDLRISWSIAKSFLSALIGLLVEDGSIRSLDAQVTDYAPLLMGSAYEGVTIRNVLQTSSGVKFDEDYLDYNSDINRMGRVIALGQALDSFTAKLVERISEPGAAWKYVSIDTHVIGMVIRGATGRSIPDLLSERIIIPMGVERTPFYVTDGEGVAFVLGGLNMTTRDYARLGLMYAQKGKIDGQQVVPSAWVEESTAATAPTTEDEYGYGYQWWIPKGATPGEFMARGIYGQYLYINQRRGIVIATSAADRSFRDTGVDDQNVALFRLIAESL
ncbi:serine hydrolase [Pseudohalocynthiibacter sp. F2068]|jgi:CubicO group peptidase (beta-lactamase class C family)|uniref:serine hydrolase domain-containing protein n=1 Tax=Pseudohalocynthiibacter sp. F2068 TaxID=2926418 RepID=UPI001FF3CE0F|nr:serine hydrolase [Pseudohalocynthiibacter sp. F2068]MCK0102334.1 beta-lactamase family protein [Pseudohalocynthiibacter sp. F2068]